ncbi:MAG: hypothetical protein EOP06_27210 [Proteobacteria bacterium]|nr:MAG: hypothetical protein EOP06_27210 [Pseudomonadota bacterium]
MRFLLLALLFAVIPTSAQHILVKTDGTKIPVYSYTILAAKKRIDYKVNSQTGSVKFEEIDSLVVDKRVIKPFKIGNKLQLLDVIASANGKTLAVSSKIKKRERGGFESAVKYYQVYIIDKAKVQEKLAFTASKVSSEAKKRAQFFTIVSSNFLDCNALMERLALFQNDTNTDNLILLNYLDNPERLYCK